MRILVGADVPKDPNSGAAGTVYYTNNALRELGHEVDEIWAPDLGRKIRHGNLHYLIELPRRYRDVVRERSSHVQYDVIQLSQPHAYLAAEDHIRSKRPGIFVNRSHGVELRVEKVVTYWRKRLGFRANRFPRSIFTTILQALLSRHWTSVAKASNGIIVGCEEDRSFLISHLCVSPVKVKVIQYGIPYSFITRKVIPMQGERINRLLYVGQYAFLKAPHILADAVNKLLTLNDEILFTWVCDRQDHDKIMHLFTPKVLNRVHLLNWLPQNELVSIFDSHGIFLFPSFFEGFGKAPLEAMSRGLCVVASDTGGMRDIIRNQENGFLLPVGGVSSLVKKVIMLHDNPDLMSQISCNARTSAIQYTWRRCAEETSKFYELLLARKSSFT